MWEERTDHSRQPWRLSYSSGGKCTSQISKRRSSHKDERFNRAHDDVGQTKQTTQDFVYGRSTFYNTRAWTLEDVEGIQHLIHEVDGGSHPCMEPNIGWMSPLKARTKSPIKRLHKIHQSSHSVTLSPQQENYLTGQQEAASNGECCDQKIENIDGDNLKCFLEVLELSENAQMHGVSTVVSSTDHPANNTPEAPVKQGSERWTTILSPELKEKLHQAEQMFELELAKERSRCLTKLKEILQAGKKAHLNDLELRLYEEWKGKRKTNFFRNLSVAIVYTISHHFDPPCGHSKFYPSLEQNYIAEINIISRVIKNHVQNQIHEQLKIEAQQCSDESARKIQQTRNICAELSRYA
jgi:hypothetical protein